MYFFRTGHWPVKYFVLTVVKNCIKYVSDLGSDTHLHEFLLSAQSDWTEMHQLSNHSISQQDEIIMTSSQNWDSMRLEPDVLLLSAKQHPFLLQPFFCWQVGGSFFIVTVFTDMGQLLTQAQSYSEELILGLVCIIQPNCIICQDCVSGKCNC